MKPVTANANYYQNQKKIWKRSRKDNGSSFV